MPDSGESKTIIETIIYAGGTVLGIAAKLADMHRRKNITKKDVIVNSILALATAFCVYWLLKDWGVNQNIANGVSVLCGRFSDDVLKLIWKNIRKGLGWNDENKQN